MDKKSKLIFWLLVLSIIVSVASLFYKTLILQDFEIVVSDDEPVDDISE